MDKQETLRRAVKELNDLESKLDVALTVAKTNKHAWPAVLAHHSRDLVAGADGLKRNVVALRTKIAHTRSMALPVSRSISRQAPRSTTSNVVCLDERRYVKEVQAISGRLNRKLQALIHETDQFASMAKHKANDPTQYSTEPITNFNCFLGTVLDIAKMIDHWSRNRPV
jgi:hypothetical protein